MKIVENSSYFFIKNLAFLMVRFVISYVKAIFLTGSVIFSLSILIFIMINLKPDFSFGFMRLFSFLNPAYATGTFKMGMKEIMEVFSVVSFAIMIIVSSIKILLKKTLNYKLVFNHKFLILFLLITFAYAAASAIVALSDKLDKGFYGVFAFFYVINLASAMLFLLFDAIYKKLPVGR